MGGFIYTLLGTSKDVTLGPTAIMSLLCFSVVGGMPRRAVLLSLLCGLVQAGMAVLRLGETGRGASGDRVFLVLVVQVSLQQQTWNSSDIVQVQVKSFGCHGNVLNIDPVSQM